jgi:hypothetical protein
MNNQIMKLSYLLAIALVAFSCNTAQVQTLDKLLGSAKKAFPLGEDETGKGLKEALEIGVSKGADALARPDGYFKSPYKILLPTEAQKVVSRLQSVPGFQGLEADLTERLNRAAEDAATKAKPIFLNAIRQLTFQDAINILMGEKNAATQFLVRTTRTPLYDAFQPVINESLEKVNAVSLWSTASTTYNKIPLVSKVNTKLDDHVTNKALDGLFLKIEEEERNIRANPLARTSELLKKVFSKQDK